MVVTLKRPALSTALPPSIVSGRLLTAASDFSVTFRGRTMNQSIMMAPAMVTASMPVRDAYHGLGRFQGRPAPAPPFPEVAENAIAVVAAVEHERAAVGGTY